MGIPSMPSLPGSWMREGFPLRLKLPNMCSLAGLPTLTGLPPDPAQLSDYLNDESPGAYERWLDQLLKNPAYGEHQARF